MLTRKCQNHFFPLRYILICLVFITSISSYSQSISPATQNIGGTLGLQSNYTLTFSVGEMVSTTHFVGPDKTSLSSGFLQSFSPLVTGIENITSITPGTISILPNPVISKMYLKARVAKPGQIEFNIVDVLSNMKFQSSSSRIYDEFIKEVDVSDFVSGVYYVRVLFKPILGAPEVGIYKLVKL
jgi:hypothetical protein